jgi:hypothetical protein
VTRFAAGFLSASVVAVCLGVLIGLSRTLYQALNPFIQLLKPISPLAWMGPQRQAFCIDYSVGYRFKARHFQKPLGDQGGLAALRWPEKTLIFDDLEETFLTT